MINMRDATPEEEKSVNDYIRSISVPTGVNFWDIPDGIDTEIAKINSSDRFIEKVNSIDNTECLKLCTWDGIKQ